MLFLTLLLGCPEGDFIGNRYDFESAEGYQPANDDILFYFPAAAQWWRGSSELSYSAACNTVTARFMWSDGVMYTHGVGTTEMGCGGESDAQDAWFADLFWSNPWLEVHDDLLVISDGEATLFFRERVEQERPPLED